MEESKLLYAKRARRSRRWWWWSPSWLPREDALLEGLDLLEDVCLVGVLIGGHLDEHLVGSDGSIKESSRGHQGAVQGPSRRHQGAIRQSTASGSRSTTLWTVSMPWSVSVAAARTAHGILTAEQSAGSS